jgi:hypothetical protein
VTPSSVHMMGLPYVCLLVLYLGIYVCVAFMDVRQQQKSR